MVGAIPRPGDIVITKRQWGVFYGTALELQLRRRGIRTLVYGGLATNFGVESTARDAYERGFEQVFVEDAMSGLTEGAHQFAITTIFPRMGRIRSTDEVLAAGVTSMSMKFNTPFDRWLRANDIRSRRLARKADVSRLTVLRLRKGSLGRASTRAKLVATCSKIVGRRVTESELFWIGSR